MADYTIDDYKRAARKAYAAGNVAAAEELAQAGMALQAQAAEPVDEIDTPLEYAKDIGGAALAADLGANSSQASSPDRARRRTPHTAAASRAYEGPNHLGTKH